jgi:hypothetical protein
MIGPEKLKDLLKLSMAAGPNDNTEIADFIGEFGDRKSPPIISNIFPKYTEGGALKRRPRAENGRCRVHDLLAKSQKLRLPVVG